MTPTVYSNDEVFVLVSGPFTIEVDKQDLSGQLRIHDEYAADIDHVPEFLKDMKTIEREFRERYEGGSNV